MGKERTNNTTFTEQATRNRIVNDVTNRFGPDAGVQMVRLFNKWDKIIASCKNEAELKHMKAMACADIYKTVGYARGLTVGGKVIIPDDQEPVLKK